LVTGALDVEDLVGKLGAHHGRSTSRFYAGGDAGVRADAIFRA
jgi:hypothetical protein